MEINITPAAEGRGRKKLRVSREDSKFRRYAATSLPKYPSCKHGARSSFQCSSLTMSDIKLFHHNFYKNKDKISQDIFILKYCDSTIPKRHKYEPTKKPRSVSTKYTVLSPSNSNETIPICRDAFLGILGIGKDRVARIVKQFSSSGQAPRENRGGDRLSQKSEQKRTHVKKFIESLKCSIGHYCRSKTNARYYLPSDLNIRKLWRMYNETVESLLRVRQCFFRNIFITCYNIGFGSPATDVCSVCLQLTEKIKRETDPEKKINMMCQKRIHNLRANSFYDFLRSKESNVMTFSYDCQKNMPLPKVPDQSCYYSRQLYCYNFTVVKGSSKDKLLPENVLIYTWNENDRPKSSNEIASAVYNTLINTDFPSGIDTVRLISDGCGGQNKNTSIVTMCFKWLKSAPQNISRLEIIFPITGHSFLPPDRVFGQIEKVVKKKETIVTPGEYVNIFEQFGTVIKLGRDTPIYDWKNQIRSLKNLSQWHYKFNEAKRMIITRSKGVIKIRGEPFYKSDIGFDKSVFKKGKNVDMINLELLPLGIPVKKEKISDIEKLLRNHFGDEWSEQTDLEFYRGLIDTAVQCKTPDDTIYLCEPQTENIDLRV